MLFKFNRRIRYFYLLKLAAEKLERDLEAAATKLKEIGVVEDEIKRIIDFIKQEQDINMQGRLIGSIRQSLSGKGGIQPIKTLSELQNAKNNILQEATKKQKRQENVAKLKEQTKDPDEAEVEKVLTDVAVKKWFIEKVCKQDQFIIALKQNKANPLDSEIEEKKKNICSKTRDL